MNAISERVRFEDEQVEAVVTANALLDVPNADPDDDLRLLSRQLLRRHEELAGGSAMWVSVKDRLPEKGYRHSYLVWIPNTTSFGGYWETAAFGDYVCEVEDADADDPHYVENNDEGNWKGSGWHREEDAHGGPYDTIFVDLNSKVTHWMPLPKPPEVPA